MAKRTRRNHSPAFKAKVAIAAIKGDRTIQQLADQFDIHVSQITTWKDQLQAGAVEVFEAGPSGKPSAPEIDIKSLHARTAPRSFASMMRRGSRFDNGVAEQCEAGRQSVRPFQQTVFNQEHDDGTFTHITLAVQVGVAQYE